MPDPTSVAERIAAWLDATDPLDNENAIIVYDASTGADAYVVIADVTIADLRQLLTDHAAATKRVAELEARPQPVMVEFARDLTEDEIRQWREAWEAEVAKGMRVHQVITAVPAPFVGDCDCDCQPGQPCLCPERDCYCGPCPVCDRDETTHQTEGA